MRERKDTESSYEPMASGKKKHVEQAEVAPSPRTFLVIFRCPVCHVPYTAYMAPGVGDFRVCRSTYDGPPVPLGSAPGTHRAMLPSGRQCGAMLAIAHDERPGRAA